MSTETTTSNSEHKGKQSNPWILAKLSHESSIKWKHPSFNSLLGISSRVLNIHSWEIE